MTAYSRLLSTFSSSLKRKGRAGAEYIVRHFQSILTDYRVEAPLPEDLRKDIQRAARQLLRTKHLPNPIEMFGCKINFLGSLPFRDLVKEIFLEPSYFFRADTESPLIFDCGSNIGMSVLFFKKLYPKARIVAFEPDPFTFEALSNNVAQNHLANVQLHQGALGELEGQVEFFRDASAESSSLLMSTIRERHNGPSIKVPALRLSSFISAEIDLLKIDIEGAEGIVLRELADADKLRWARRIHLEYHHHIDKSVDNLSSLLRLMEEHHFGYQIRSTLRSWPVEREFQDVSIYFYRK